MIGVCKPLARRVARLNSASARAALRSPPYRRISYALVAPSRRGEIGALAEATFQERYGGLRGLRSPDFALLARLLGGGRAQSRGELLLFVLFDEVFIERLLQAGRADAERWLAAHPAFWSSDAAAVGFETADVPADTIALDEFRALKRR